MCCLFYYYYFVHLLTDSQNSAVGSGSPSHSLVHTHEVQLYDISPLNCLLGKQATHTSAAQPLTFVFFFLKLPPF